MFEGFNFHLLMLGIVLLTLPALSGLFYAKISTPILKNVTGDRDIGSPWKPVEYEVALLASKIANMIFAYSLTFIVAGLLCIFIALILAHHFIAVFVMVVLLVVFIYWLLKNMCVS